MVHFLVFAEFMDKTTVLSYISITDETAHLFSCYRPAVFLSLKFTLTDRLKWEATFIILFFEYDPTCL